MTNSWEPQHQQNTEIDKLGATLSIVLDCPVRLIAYSTDKPMFQCKHGITFGLFLLKGAKSANDWGLLIEKHNQERPADV